MQAPNLKQSAYPTFGILALILGFMTFVPDLVRAELAGHSNALAALAPPNGAILHGTYPGGFTGDEDDITLGQVKAYEQAVGAPVAWVYFSHNWFQGHAFPTETARWILDHDATPFVRLMMRTDTVEDHGEPFYKLARINSGEFDADLTAWGREIAALNVPIIAEFGTEMNGRWFPWNGHWNGGNRGPERFRDAYRRIINLTRAAGADNIIWVFHVNAHDDPQVGWNRFEEYYPGDAYIDWLGVSAYSMLGPHEDEPLDFAESFGDAYQRLSQMAPSKPVIVAEFGTDVRNPLEPAPAWADKALGNILSGRWPNVIGFSWWNETWPNDDDPNDATDLRVTSDRNLARVFRTRLAQHNLITGR